MLDDLRELVERHPEARLRIFLLTGEGGYLGPYVEAPATALAEALRLPENEDVAAEESATEVT